MLTLEETIKLILEKRSDLERKDVLKLIAEKRQQMGPELVNDESAAMIVARDLGIDLYQLSPRPRLKIEEINEGKRNVTITAKVIGIDSIREFSRPGGETGKVTSLTIADDTGKIRVVLWDEMTRVVEEGTVTVGSWIQIRNAYVKRGLRDALELNLGRMGGLRVLDEHETKEIDIEIIPVESVKIKDLEEAMFDITIKFKILRTSSLRTFTRKDGTVGKVLSIIGADDSGSTRIVFWDEHAELMEDAKEGEIVQLERAYTRKGRYGDVEVHAGRSSTITRNLQEEIKAVEELVPSFQEFGLQPISKLNVTMRDVDIEGKVLRIFPKTTFQKDGGEGQVQNILVTDGSATVRVTFWNEDVEKIRDLEEGDTIRIRHGYIKEGFRGGVEFHVGKRAEIEINPAGISFDDIDLSQISQVETVGSKTVLISAIDESMLGKNVEVRGIIMSLSQRSPIYPACPNCKKKLEERSDGFRCTNCGSIPEPEYRLLFKVTLDDGSGNIPITLFDRVAEELLGTTASEIQKSGNLVEVSNQIAQKIIGCRVVINGRISKFRDLLEIAAISLKRPDTISEIEKERELIQKLME